MKSFKEFITEAFDTPYKINGPDFESDRDMVKYTAKSDNGTKIVCDFPFPLNDRGIQRVMGLHVELNNKQIRNFTPDKNKPNEMFRIFATVLQVIKDFNEYVEKEENKKLQVVTFDMVYHSDTDEKLGKIIDKITKKYLPSGWGYKKTESKLRTQAAPLLVTFKILIK